MAKETFDYKSIPGWGMDSDPENEPTYPMKNYTGDDHNRIHYERSPQQPVTVEILQSTERPLPPAVFGTSVPPSGLSGMIRRYAFKHSEDRYRHWLPLILADRINVWEGIIDDLCKGHVPNVFAEKGMRATWKHNPRKIIDTVLVGAVLAITLMGVFKKKK
jgi:hypothetical protein